MNAPAASTVTRKLDELFKPWNRSDAPGLVVGVAHKGKVIYRRGFGLASVEHGTANTPLTRMRIGSTSKHFAVICALLLAEEGRLDVDAPLRKAMPELAGIIGEPTLRELMRHTSGLRDPQDMTFLLLNKTYRNVALPGNGRELGKRFASSNFPRGERMIYCNQGYQLLSLAVERVAGMPFGDFLQQRVLAPMGMSETVLLPSDMLMLPGIASQHVPMPDGKWYRGIYPSDELLGAGGMVSTIDDMLRWIAHLRGPDKIVGTKKSWEQMLERPRYSSGAEGDYCLGLTREHYRGVEIIHHAGAVLGGTCQMLTVPAHELDISLMFNRMDGAAPATALKVVEAVLGEILAPVVPPRIEGREHLFGHWYNAASQRLLRIHVHTSPGQAPVLALSVQETVAGPIAERDGRWVMATASHGTIEIDLPEAGSQPDRIEVSDSGHKESYVRLPGTGPAAEKLAKELAGRYRYPDFDIDLAVVLDDGSLWLDLLPYSGRSRLKLQALGADVFGMVFTSDTFIPYPLTGSLIIERQDGRVTGFWLNSMRTRRLWVERVVQ
ncbi:MAG: serine hydrolase domain-containing protein [Stenotrophobium sp.]